MIDLQNSAFIFHVRVDTVERKKNISTIINFYRKNCTNFNFIFVEDDSNEKLPSIIFFEKNDIYMFEKNVNMWNKCKSFNTGIKKSQSDILIFHDLDVILNPSQLLTTINILKENKNYGLMYPYNGLFLCVNKQIKNTFSRTLDYKDLEKYFPLNLSVNFSDDNVLVGHNNSVGGCVLGRRDNILKCNGYNPNFIGWGYEDNEFPKRIHILGYPVTRLNEPKAPLWHLPHDGEGSSPKADNPFYEQNRQLCSYVENSKKDVLEQYIKKWKL
jgi:predicted glycosyltransferase involved in capsule biosynthesis